ncbi:MAG TPA: 3-isopropylmalate dehydrogenase [Candidatus Acidoferrales bacterium]|nr:3-isopropylmalate dehydrogenase [Candidatus Acidoferrales bacterium]
MSRVNKKIIVLPGDGIGPEVTAAATRLLADCASAFDYRFDLQEMPFGGNAIDRCGEPLPSETLEACRHADAILLGAVGGPKWDSQPIGKRAESGLLALRGGLELYVNYRPIRVRESLVGISPVRAEKVRGCNFEIIRELAGDIYFGAHEHYAENGRESARDLAQYSEDEIERIARYAFERAAARRRRLVSVDKANVLATSVLWRKTVTRVANDYPGVTLEHMYVDNAAMQIVLNPARFDVIVTSNLFGDILSDEAAALAGSIGLIPSMSRGRSPIGALYEPIHGSAPSLAGRDIASPLGSIFCVSLMLRESFGLHSEAEWIESAVDRVLEQGYRTADIAEPGTEPVGCSKIVELIRAEMSDSLVHAERYGWGV